MTCHRSHLPGARYQFSRSLPAHYMTTQENEGQWKMFRWIGRNCLLSLGTLTFERPECRGRFNNRGIANLDETDYFPMSGIELFKRSLTDWRF